MKRPGTALGVASLVFAVVSAPPTSIWKGHTARTPARSARISVVVNRSFCVSSGILERRTGEGIARFYFTLRNTGPRTGRVNVTPVLVYDDGAITKSARHALVGIVVPAHTVRTHRSPAYEYHARSHTIFGCGLLIDGHAVPINFI